MNSILSNFIMDVCSEGIQSRQGDWKTMYNVLVFFFSCAKLTVKAFERLLHLGFLIIRNIVQAGAEIWVHWREISMLDQWLAGGSPELQCSLTLKTQ